MKSLIKINNVRLCLEINIGKTYRLKVRNFKKHFNIMLARDLVNKLLEKDHHKRINAT